VRAKPLGTIAAFTVAVPGLVVVATVPAEVVVVPALHSFLRGVFLGVSKRGEDVF